MAAAVDEVESGARARTRAAILDAAAAIWARDFSASLSAVADQADVSRSTLHRYFTDRQALIDALLADSFERFDAMPSPTSPNATSMAELELFLRSGIDMGDRVIFLFADPSRFEGNPLWDDQTNEDEMEAAIDRARAEGSIAADIPTAWATNLFYAVLYTAAEVSNAGVPRHVAADLAVRAFVRGVAP